MELPDLIRDFVDYVMPQLQPYDVAYYLYLLRHSILASGSPLLRVGRESVRSGVVKTATGTGTLSYQKVQEVFAALESIGALRREGDADRRGTLYRLLAPIEIPGVEESKRAARPVTATTARPEEPDHYNVRENRLKVYERDAFRCRHCGKQLTLYTVTLDHVHAVSQGGDNSLENLVTSCLECNSKKAQRTLGDFTAESNS